MLTFSNTPRSLLNKSSHRLITTPHHKNRLLESLGVDILIDIPFTQELSQLSPEAFIALIEKTVPIARWVVGEDFRFGYQRAGTLQFLQEYATKVHQEVFVVEKIEDGGDVISSTRIREMIQEGDIQKASILLGRPYSIFTKVHGGVLDVTGLCLPPEGIWAVTVIANDTSYDGRLSIMKEGCFLTASHGQTQETVEVVLK